VVLVSSMAHWLPFPRAEAYGASKAALSWFADSLRLDWEPKGIAVTVVSPGFVDTPLTRKNDFAMPGRVSVDEAVKAIRIGLAAGKCTSRFLPVWLHFAAALRAACVSSAHAAAQDGAFMNIAIIGSGIAGLTCAWRLAGHHQVTLFEAGATPGGHTATVDATPQGTWAIDTGFIVYNDRTYPRFMGLLSELGISGQKTQMSFSVHNPRRGWSTTDTP
jgi:hypothetical protein